jgi:hypothetical protein
MTGAAGKTGAAGNGTMTGAAGNGTTTGASGATGAAGTGAGGTAPCGPTNCPGGCCDLGRCITARTASRCGTGGGACKACSKCELCTNAGACDIDPGSSWTIVAGQATVATSPDSGPNWDPHGGQIGGIQPDPFCQFEMPTGTVTQEAAGVTDTIIDSFKPVWNQVISPQGKTILASDLMSSSKNWRIWVGDDDGCTVRDGCIGTEICEFSQPLTAGVLRAGQVTHENLQSCLSVTVKFVCQP